MADARIAGHALRQRHCIDQLLLLEQFLHATMCPKMAQLKLHDRLTGDRESEVAGLYDPRMDRTDGNFKDTLALNFSKGILPLNPPQNPIPRKVFFERV